MREIKFRAWDTEANNWLEGTELVIHYKGHLLNVPEYIILMQWTGLKDKKGREIYEGDILSCSYDKPITLRDEHVWPHQEFVVTPEERKGEVYWSDGSFKLFDHGKQDWMLLGVADVKNMEIIGNIYEHPGMVPPEKVRRYLKTLWR